MQALLDRAGCPYQGSGPAGSFLALHKSAAKSLFRRAGLSTPDWIFLPERPAPGWEPRLPYPLFVKSDTGGSSLHLYRVRNGEELQCAMDRLFASGQTVLIEPLIRGREATCGVLERGGRAEALPPVLIVPKHEFFDYHAKYTDAGECEICPAPLPEALLEEVRKTALEAHRCLGLRGYSRTDFILGDDGAVHVLEVNTLPGMTPASLVPKEAAALGMDFGELLEVLLKEAVLRGK